MPYIPLEEVESSNIVAIGYHRQTTTLRIRFQGDRYYDYPMVPEREYKALMEAESKGKFFNTRIKPMYGHRNVRPEALLEPCCEHTGPDPTCVEECFPCQEWCCPGPGPSAETMRAAVGIGLRRGESLMASVKSVVEGRIDECPHGEGDRTCDEGCVCTCHVVPPSLPLTADGEVDVSAIPDVTHLFSEADEDEAEEDMRYGK